jgi:hypothetical protein
MMRYYIAALVATAVLMTSIFKGCHYFHITAGTLRDSSVTFAQQAGESVMRDMGTIARTRTNAVEGWHTSGTALDIMLKGTGLSWEEKENGFKIKGRNEPQDEEPAKELDIDLHEQILLLRGA